jgi:hypothetical protein
MAILQFTDQSLRKTETAACFVRRYFMSTGARQPCTQPNSEKNALLNLHGSMSGLLIVSHITI